MKTFALCRRALPGCLHGRREQTGRQATLETEEGGPHPPRESPSCGSALVSETCNYGKRPLGLLAAPLFLLPAARVSVSGAQAPRYKTAEQINKPPPALSSPVTPPLSPSPTPSSVHSLSLHSPQKPHSLVAWWQQQLLQSASLLLALLLNTPPGPPPAAMPHQWQMRNTCLELERSALSSRGHFTQNVCASESQAWISGVPKENRFMASASPGVSVWPFGPEPLARHRKTERKGLICIEEP